MSRSRSFRVIWSLGITPHSIMWNWVLVCKCKWALYWANISTDTNAALVQTSKMYTSSSRLASYRRLHEVKALVATYHSTFHPIEQNKPPKKGDNYENKTRITIIYFSHFVQLQWCTTLHCHGKRDSHGTFELHHDTEHQMIIPHQHKYTRTLWSRTPIPTRNFTKNQAKKNKTTTLKQKRKPYTGSSTCVKCAGFKLHHSTCSELHIRRS